LLRAIFVTEPVPRIRMNAIVITTMPNKVRKFAFLSRFDKIVYIMRTDVITNTRKRLTIKFVLTRYICISELSNFITGISQRSANK
jgi:hypothetical protein